MITVRRVVSPDYLTPNVATGRAERADIDRRAATPETSPAWWWGVAPGLLLTPGNTAARPVNTPGSAASPTTGSGIPCAGSGGCG